ncbi:MAG: type II secretion system F family protein, partial [Epsilonproteobacteria bacterium]|nr:type II secretion system F family protein [Campylobacterota bacterium]
NIKKRPMKGSLMSAFSKELSSYLESGMPIVTALKLMYNQHKNEKKYAAFIEEVKKFVEEGKPLYVALSSQSVYELPDFFLQSINVSGQSGRMGEVLATMGEFFSSQDEVKKQATNALIYPSFIFLVAIGMTAFLITFVVPKITQIFEDTGQKLPAITKFVLGMSDFFTNYWIHTLVVLIIIVALFQFSYAKIQSFRKLIDRVLLKMPAIGNIIQNYELSRFSYILSLMLDSGVSYAQAVQLATTTFNNSALKETFTQAANKVVEGNKLSVALFRAKGVKPKKNFLQSIALGEESSSVSSVLKSMANLYTQENQDKIKVLLSLLEPFMMLFIGAIVGTIVLAMLLPIFSMSLGAKH